MWDWHSPRHHPFLNRSPMKARFCDLSHCCNHLAPSFSYFHNTEIWREDIAKLKTPSFLILKGLSVVVYFIGMLKRQWYVGTKKLLLWITCTINLPSATRNKLIRNTEDEIELNQPAYELTGEVLVIVGHFYKIVCLRTRWAIWKGNRPPIQAASHTLTLYKSVFLLF